VNYTYVANFTALGSATWQYVTVTIPPPPNIGTASFPVSNGVGFELYIGGVQSYYTDPVGVWTANYGFSTASTYNWPANAGNYIEFTGVQLEKGTVATPFEVRPYATELALCQRYYYQLTSPTAAAQGSSAVYAVFGTATGITSTAFWLPIQFPVPMRAPNYTLTNSAVSNFQLLPTGTTTITGVGFQSDSYTPISATLNFAGTNITPGTSYIFRTNNLTGSTTAFFGISCEL
jgi:hypothetical protein